MKSLSKILISIAARTNVIILCTFIVLLVPQFAQAQNLTLSITPPIIEVAIKPGKSVLIAYTVSNLGDPATLSSFVRPFIPAGQRGELYVGEEFSGPIRFSLDNSNIELEDPFFLNSREGQQLLLKIRVPEGTPEGDYYYSFLATNETGKIIEGSTAAQSVASVGSNILITVTETGVVDVNGRIGKLEVLAPYTFDLFGNTIHLFESTDTVPVQLTLENHGRNLIKPHGSLALKGNLGERAEFEILPQNILAQSARTVIATPSAELHDERSQQSSLNIDGFFIGKYTITAQVDFGDGTQTVTAATDFYGIPIKLLAATTAALIIGLVIIKNFGKDEEML